MKLISKMTEVVVGTATALLLLAPFQAQALQQSNPLKPTSFWMSAPTNMYFRIPVEGVGGCARGFGYVDETDPGSHGKIAALLTAYSLGKRVVAVVDPTDYYHNGTTYCHIFEFNVID